MSALPTASQLSLAMACVGSCVLPRCDSVSEAADEGTALHNYIAGCAAGNESALDLVPEQWRERAASIKLERLPLHATHEQSYAVNASLTSAVLLPNRSAYSDSLWCGTADAWAPGEVGEYKTGRVPVPPPAKNWQLRLGALANHLHTGADEVTATLYTIGQGGFVDAKPHVFDALDHLDTAAQLQALQRRLEIARLDVAAGNTPLLTTGKHCRYCPSLRFCPAQTRLLRATLATWAGRDATAIDLRELDDGELAEAYAHTKALKSHVSALEAALYARAAQEPFPVSDTMWFGEQEVEGNERITNPAAAAHAVDAVLGSDAVVIAVPPDPKCTKSAIKTACSKFAPKGKAAAAEREIMKRLREAGAVERPVTRRVTVYSK